MNKQNKCPVCGAPYEINTPCCPICGWEFRLFPESVSEAVLSNEEKRIAAYRAVVDRNGKQTERIEGLYKREPVRPDAELRKKAEEILMPAVDRSAPVPVAAEIQHGVFREVLYRLAHGNFTDAINYLKNGGR